MELQMLEESGAVKPILRCRENLAASRVLLEVLFHLRVLLVSSMA